jgi:hypothetical protein
MKGPSERLKYDMRRIWECPICRHREGTGGNVTSRLCSCQEQVPATTRQYMRMVQDGARRVIEPKVPVAQPDVTIVSTEIIVSATAVVEIVDRTDRTDPTDPTDLSPPSDPNPTDRSNPSPPSDQHPSDTPP